MADFGESRGAGDNGIGGVHFFGVATGNRGNILVRNDPRGPVRSMAFRGYQVYLAGADG